MDNNYKFELKYTINHVIDGHPKEVAINLKINAETEKDALKTIHCLFGYSKEEAKSILYKINNTQEKGDKHV